MNKKVRGLIAAILNAEDDYREIIEETLRDYREKKEKIAKESKRYKVESDYIKDHLPEAQETARRNILLAEEAFRKELQKRVSGLKAELLEVLKFPIDPKFMERIGFYRTAGIVPSRTECEALLQLAGKNPVAVKALAKLLDDTKAPVCIESRSIEDFEQDLANLDDLCEMPLLHGPTEYHTELCDLMTGQRKPTRTASGWAFVGHRWEGSVDLLLQETAVTSRLKALETVADAWSADVTWSVRERQAEFSSKPDSQEPTSSTRIAERTTNAETLAAELGREQPMSNVRVGTDYLI